jgi:hypothetical protein
MWWWLDRRDIMRVRPDILFLSREPLSNLRMSNIVLIWRHATTAAIAVRHHHGEWWLGCSRRRDTWTENLGATGKHCEIVINLLFLDDPHPQRDTVCSSWKIHGMNASCSLQSTASLFPHAFQNNLAFRKEVMKEEIL